MDILVVAQFEHRPKTSICFDREGGFMVHFLLPIGLAADHFQGVFDLAFNRVQAWLCLRIGILGEA
jgi:hypothetical protein